MLDNAGFIRYEVSNYAASGHQCRHNLAYWNLMPYLGLGPAAHSFLASGRCANTADVTAYCAAISQGRLAIDSCDKQDAATLAREMIFLGLR